MKYRKKPVVIEAIQWDGTHEQAGEVIAFADGAVFVRTDLNHKRQYLWIDTLEGQLKVSPGDFVIRGLRGEYYPCKPDIFEATYEQVEEITNATTN